MADPRTRASSGRKGRRLGGQEEPPRLALLTWLIACGRYSVASEDLAEELLCSSKARQNLGVIRN